MAATTLLFADNASTTLAASITAAATTCTLAPGTGALFPVPGANQAFPLTFVDAATGLVTEIVKVTGMSGDTVTSMVRGQEGTAARAWLAGDLASNFWTAGALGAGAMAQVGPLQQGTYGYAVDGGSANTVVLTLSPAVTSYVDGLPVNFKAAANNSGATTINVNGVGAVALQGAAGALQGGEIVAGKTYEANYNSTSNTFVIVGQGGGAEQVSPATQSQHALQAGQALGLFLGVQTFTSSGTYTPGVYTVGGRSVTATKAIVKAVGGGGGGGGASATSATQVSFASGGNAGAYGELFIGSGLSSQTVTIGAGGSAAVAGQNNGGNGGSTSFGSLMVCAGGGGGVGAPAGAPPGVTILNSTIAQVTGSGNVIASQPGAMAKVGVSVSTSVANNSSGGGDTPFGQGGYNQTVLATGYGAGGPGAGAGPNAASGTAGTTGRPGYMLVFEYA
jgi:hypothetical protein